MANLFDSPWKIMIVAVVIIVLFGSRKLPDAARSLGKSMRILKTEVQSMHDEPAAPAAAPLPSQAQIQAVQAPAAPSGDAQAQIDALQRQLSQLQESVAANGAASTAAPADAQQAK
jgi:sec-independent protein translocase protein TatA